MRNCLLSALFCAAWAAAMIWALWALASVPPGPTAQQRADRHEAERMTSQLRADRCPAHDFRSTGLLSPVRCARCGSTLGQAGVR